MADEVYFVEKVLDRQIRSGKPYYLIKWEGKLCFAIKKIFLKNESTF